MSVASAAAVRLRDLAQDDLEEVARIDALHTGREKPAYWSRVFDEFVARGGSVARVGLAAELEGVPGLVGYLLGEVRAFEFGSEPCGWIFSVGVDPAHAREGIASQLLTEACSRFRATGVATVRTMVRRDDIPVLSFFRRCGFVGGSFYQLEMSLGVRT
jgi:ribosomal protein S18 acetylase RimI-like enzyme